MKAIWKYPLSMNTDGRHRMPPNAKIVAVNYDGNGNPCIWAEVDPTMGLTEERQFGVYGTGGQVPDTWEYRGTFYSLPYVWHVYENLEPRR